MKLVKSLLLGSAAGLFVVGGAQAADLPVKKAVPIEYVRVCTAYGAGFFYIPGTDTCLRVSGRARAEYGYIGSDNRRVTGGGDLSGFTGLARFNFDARTQTGYGTLRAFLRLDAASRTGNTKISSGTNLRGGYAFSGTGQDAFGRIQNFINVDKAFIQFAGLTAGRASSFYDFYAADFEIIGSSLGSNMPSTNLLAYTQKFGDGWTATISMEDPNYRKNPLFTNAVPAAGAAAGTGALSQVLTTAPTPIILGTDALGNATAVAFIDAVQRSRLPDFVGALRYDAAWGSAQLSAAVREINTGGFISSVGVPGAGATQQANAQALLAARGLGGGVAQTEYGWAVQGGVKLNLPFIAPGDGIYLQGSYGEGASFYTGINRFTAGYLANASVYAGNPFNQYLADAVVNPLTGKIELSSSFTAVASYLHYWSPEWRSAFYASYGEIWFPTGARQATSQANSLVNSPNTVAPGSYLTNPAGFATSQSLRDTYQIVTGASLIWSPVKDLDIGIEGQYIRTGVKSGRVADQDKGGFIGSGNAQVPTRTVSSEDVFQARFRVQRDF
ncbi:porin [Methylorubrum extorquens]|uniref:porin n=1 Tax=Methylorubrum extorquens TaxID=408 RepID=UPI0022372CD8|nr:porin [Methylorubrum extorquens]UYW24459.1 porin [Methylorubrum extorquens]